MYRPITFDFELFASQFIVRSSGLNMPLTSRRDTSPVDLHEQETAAHSAGAPSLDRNRTTARLIDQADPIPAMIVVAHEVCTCAVAIEVDHFTMDEDRTIQLDPAVGLSEGRRWTDRSKPTSHDRPKERGASDTDPLQGILDAARHLDSDECRMNTHAASALDDALRAAPDVAVRTTKRWRTLQLAQVHEEP